MTDLQILNTIVGADATPAQVSLAVVVKHMSCHQRFHIRSAVQTISGVARSAGAVKGSKSICAMSKEGAGSILAFIQIWLLTKFTTPTIIAVTL